MLSRHLERTREKIEEWKSIRGIANSYKKRESALAMEVEALGGCRCGEEVHDEFKPRIRLD